MERNIDEVVETIRCAKERGKKATLLVGAGCSVKADVPDASSLVELIKVNFPQAYSRAREKTYHQCLAELSPGERSALLTPFIDQAKINWAHIAIAQLMKSGFIDRVLTTNFDLLLPRACALLGHFPAVYDFAAAQHFLDASVPEQAIFYLHGQRAGLALLDTEERYQKHFDRLTPLFAEGDGGRPWLVAGFSGESDPVFDHLANVRQFSHNLYWIGHKDNEPPPHVRARLLVPDKYAFAVKGFDADDFFIQLARQLHCFPPHFVSQPLSHLDNVLEAIAPYPVANGTGMDLMHSTRSILKSAVQSYENMASASLSLMMPPDSRAPEFLARKHLLAGDYEEVISFMPKHARQMSPELRDLICWAHTLLGSARCAQAKAHAVPAERARLLDLACNSFAAALQLKPDFHEALNNWGNVLTIQARAQTGPAADDLFHLAASKYAAALHIKPDKHEALNNWGNAFAAHAHIKTGQAATDLFLLAGEKYAAALEIKPDKNETFYNWGNALSDQAQTRTGAEADRLFHIAGEKYQAALQIKPDEHEAWNNWGNALSDQADTKTGAEADRLYTLACEKYAAALAIKPNSHEAWNNWGAALSDQANTKTDTEADRLFAIAGEKYKAALFIKPDKHEALFNWGIALFDQARQKTAAAAALLHEQARRLFEQSETLSPGSAAYNLLCLCAREDREEDCRRWLDKSHQSGQLPPRQTLEHDPDLSLLREREWFRQFLSRLEQTTDSSAGLWNNAKGEGRNEAAPE